MISMMGRSSQRGPIQAIQRRLSPNEQKRLDKLKDRHQEVVEHEDAHYNTALSHGLEAGAPVLTDWVEGPDGKRYATGGHVMIGTGTTGNPEVDMRRAKGMIEAAEAPTSVNSELSQADKNIAAKGRRIFAENQPKAEKLKKMKDAFAGMGNKISQQAMSAVVSGMGLDIPKGQILNIIGM